MTLVANVGDLHLYNKNIRSTLRMPEASTHMLQSLKQEIINHPEINILNFLGDIQHYTPSSKNSLKYIHEWTIEMVEIGEIMSERFAELTNVQIVDRNGQDLLPVIQSGECFPLFTLKGNHDMDNEVDFTLYEYFLAQGILCEPLYMIVDGVQFNFHHYNEADRVIPRQPNVTNVVGLYHDNIDYPEMPFWMGNIRNYLAVEILDNVDVAIIGHIHARFEPVRIQTNNGTETLVYVQGSMGRTQFAPPQARDVGYVSVVNTANLAEIGTLEVPLMSVEEYFNLNQAQQEQIKRQDFRNFSLSIGEVQVTEGDVRDDIRNLDIEEDVKALGIHYLTQVIESGTTT